MAELRTSFANLLILLTAMPKYMLFTYKDLLHSEIWQQTCSQMQYFTWSQMRLLAFCSTRSHILETELEGRSITNRMELSGEINQDLFYVCYDWHEANLIKGK